MSNHKKRYTKKQVRRNRFIAGAAVVLLAVALLVLLVFGLIKHFNPDSSSSESSSGKSTSGSSFLSENFSSLPSSESSSGSSLSSQPDSLSSSASSSASSGVSSTSASSGASSGTSGAFSESGAPMLVNPDHLMPDGYVPVTAEIGDGYKLDEKAAAAWKAMQAAAWEDGVSLWAISAYRPLERQIELYNQKVQEYKNAGYSEADAKVQAGKWVAVPGTSEHTLGLAVDICSLEENFENSSQFKWLQSNCAAFGFILRYPKDKVDITKISYEPWHYRYVGSNHAQIIMDEKICLEEYFDLYLNG